MNVSYCGRWNVRQSREIDPITSDAAAGRFDSGPWFTVVLRDDGGATTTLEVEPRASVVNAMTLSAAGSIEVIRTYRAHGDRLFLEAMVFYTYPDDARHGQSESSVIETYLFQTDGVVRRELNDKSQPTVDVEDRRDVDVSQNWQPMVTFGNWDGIATANL